MSSPTAAAAGSKLLGDGVMFTDLAQGVCCGWKVDRVPGRPAAGQVGLHSGPVVFQHGDYFGRTVNIAARIGDYARPGRSSSATRSSPTPTRWRRPASSRSGRSRSRG